MCRVLSDMPVNLSTNSVGGLETARFHSCYSVDVAHKTGSPWVEILPEYSAYLLIHCSSPRFLFNDPPTLS